MVAHTPNGPAQHGVILDVSRCQPVPDGRLLVDSVATRRFRIIDSHVKDDYLVAKVGWVLRGRGVGGFVDADVCRGRGENI